MSTYTITVTDNGDVAAVANGGSASIVVSDGTSSGAGAVTSVNGHVGVVVLDAADVGAATTAQGAEADTAVQPGDLATVATTGAYSDLTGTPTLGTAAAQNTTAFDAAGAAAAAQTAAEAYTDTAVAGRVASVVAGTGVTVDATDPENPVVSATATGGGSVDSVSAGNSTITVGGTATDPTIEATVGTTAGTVAAGDDSRITGAAQKSANLGDLASSSSARTNLGLGTSAVLDVPASGDAGTGQVVKGTDSRLTNARTPTTHTHVESDVTGLTTDLAAKMAKASNLSDVASASTARTNLGLGTAATKDIPASGNASSTQVALGSDTRLSDSRTPAAHASTHASAGSDPITIAESQVTNLTTDLAAKVPTTRTVAGHALSADVTLSDSDISPVAPNDQTGTTYTFVLADGFRLVRGSNASAITATIPPNSSVAYPLGTALQIAQQGAGQITVAAGVGVTIRTPHGAKTSAQYAIVTAIKVATDEWYITGDTTT